MQEKITDILFAFERENGITLSNFQRVWLLDRIIRIMKGDQQPTPTVKQIRLVANGMIEIDREGIARPTTYGAFMAGFFVALLIVLLAVGIKQFGGG